MATKTLVPAPLSLDTAPLAAALDALEIAPGGTVTQATFDAIRAVADALRPAPAPVPESPAAG